MGDGWQLAVLWGAVLRAGNVVRVKLGTDVVELTGPAGLLPSLNLRKMGYALP